MEPYADVREQYVAFADESDSACYRAWALGVADDQEVLDRLAELPPDKAQPNLVFAAARWHGVRAPGPYDGIRAALLGPAWVELRATVLARRTQTNEAGRLATLVPALTALGEDRPLALLEVGASAGLCLYPDRWGYEWSTPDGVVTTGPAPRLRCDVAWRAAARPPLPAQPPAVAWRGGLDLHPLDVGDPGTAAWLETLVWPEHDDRRAVLAHGIELARADPPHLVEGDLLTDLPSLVEEASTHGPVVVLHSAVVAYLPPPDREAFHDLVAGLLADGACHWVSNEAAQVLPRVTATGPAPEDPGSFVLGIDGVAVAWTHGHGRSMTWL